MKPIPLKNPDVRFLPPEGWDAEIQGECGILDAYKEPSLGHFTTFWRPEPEELAALNRGAPICLRVVSRVHPPVSVGVINDQDPDYPSLAASFNEEKEEKPMAKLDLEVVLASGPIPPVVSEFLNYMSRFTHKENREAGWWNDPTTGEDLLSNPAYAPYVIATKLFLQISEVIEAGEGYRRDQNDDKLPHRSAIEVELVDVLIRVFDLAGALNLDLGGAWKEKREFNAARADHKVENRVKKGGKKF